MSAASPRSARVLVWVLLALGLLPGLALAEDAAAIARAVQRSDDRLQALWGDLDLLQAEDRLLALLKQAEGYQLDGNHLVVQEIRGLRTRIGSGPRMTVLPGGKPGLELPVRGSWGIELDVRIRVDYSFLFFGVQDEVDLTIKVQDLRAVLELASGDVDFTRLEETGLPVAGVREAALSVTLESEHPLIAKYKDAVYKQVKSMADAILAQATGDPDADVPVTVKVPGTQVAGNGKRVAAGPVPSASR